MAAVDEARCVVTVLGFGLAQAEYDALFGRVADAAHDLDQQVTCSGAYGGDGIAWASDLCNLRDGYLERAESKRALSRVEGISAQRAASLRGEACAYRVAADQLTALIRPVAS